MKSIWLLISYDHINISFGQNSITDESHILDFGTKEEMLEEGEKFRREDEYTEFKDNGDGVLVSQAIYDGMIEEGQYMLIKEIKVGG